jgi:NAD(P)-dependent dehydrogenase (short-subunit alcohol dehydrogenase family)
VFERWGRLDGLVGNAGVLGLLTPLAHLEPKEFDKAFSLNVTSNYRLVRSMDLLLRRSEAGRAVFVSSSSSHSAKPYWGLYAATKAALEAMVKSYAAELSPSKTTANVFWPGAVRTAMRAKAVPGEDPQTLPHPSDVVPKLVDMLSPAFAETRMIYDYEKKTLLPL